MKTPLSVISLSLQHMERESDPDRLAQFIQTLRSQVDTLVQRVQTLLDQETPLSLNPEPISTTDMMQQLERLFAPAAAEKRVSLQVEVDPGTLYGDREWLFQALVNALQNALEAAPSGSTIVLRCRHSREGWTCSIQDQGPGIPPEQADLVFLPGYSSKPGGTGIGLSVVRRVVEAHGGKVWMEHPSEGGTRLMMHFPDRRT
jgi:signal transduction histidine kinase